MLLNIKKEEKIFKSTIKHYLSVLPAKICTYEKALKENNECSYFLLLLPAVQNKRDGS